MAAQAPIAKETSAEMATSRVNDFCLGGSMSSSGIVLYEAMFLTAVDAYWITAANACGFF